jgi:cytochrome c-type biogenesis protein CcmH
MKKLFVCLLLLLALAAMFVFVRGSDAQAKQLQTKLYCPLCGGVRLDVCELPVCKDMKEVIAEKKAKGEGDEQIIAYFRTAYGDQVLGYPPTEGIHWLVWLAPAVLVLGGGVALWRMADGWTHSKKSAQALPSPTIAADLASRIEKELNE